MQNLLREIELVLEEIIGMGRIVVDNDPLIGIGKRSQDTAIGERRMSIAYFMGILLNGVLRLVNEYIDSG